MGFVLRGGVRVTKRDEVRGMVRRHASEALLLRSATMNDRGAAEVIRTNANHLADAVAYEVCEEYSFLELADIMEWKRTRVKR